MKIRHGGSLRHFSEKFGIPEERILDFSSNVNPLGPPASVKEAYLASPSELECYPDPEALEFRREMARRLPLWPENVMVGNGSVELLDLALRILRPRRALLMEPTFPEYRRLLNLQGSEIRSVSLRESDSFRLFGQEIFSALQNADVAIIANPNNPTGTFLSKEELEKVLREANRRNVFVILDETYADWIPEISMIKEVGDNSLFLLLRSLTHFYALPGIRMGYGLGSRKLVEKLAAHQIPWSCNRLAQKLGLIAIKDEAFAAEARQWLSQERNWLESHLRKIPMLKVYPGAANFLLVRHAVQLRPLVEELGKQGIYVRDLTEFPALGPAFIRISVRKREENQRLIEALTKNPVLANA